MSYDAAKVCDGATFDTVTWTPLNAGGLNDSAGAAANPERVCFVFSNGPSNLTIRNVSVYPGAAWGPLLGIWANGYTCTVSGRNVLSGSGAGPGSVALLGAMSDRLVRGGHKIDAGFNTQNLFPLPTAAEQILASGVPLALVSGAAAFDADTPTYRIDDDNEQYAAHIPEGHPLRGKTVTLSLCSNAPTTAGVQLLAVNTVGRFERDDNEYSGTGAWVQQSVMYRVPPTGTCYLALRRRGAAAAGVPVYVARIQLCEAGGRIG
jgi:hypothetical protein